MITRNFLRYARVWENSWLRDRSSVPKRATFRHFCRFGRFWCGGSNREPHYPPETKYAHSARLDLSTIPSRQTCNHRKVNANGRIGVPLHAFYFRKQVSRRRRDGGSHTVPLRRTQRGGGQNQGNPVAIVGFALGATANFCRYAYAQRELRAAHQR